MRNIPLSILIAGIIGYVVLLFSGLYFFRYAPTNKKIEELKKYVASSENEIKAANLRLREYKLITDEERLLWAKTEEEILTVISNKEQLHLLASEIASVGAFLDDIVDMSYSSSSSSLTPANPNNPNNPNPTAPASSTPGQSQAQGQASGESGQSQSQSQSAQSAQSAQVDYTLLKMKFYCKYGELLDFLNNLNQLKRLIAIESLNIKKAMPKILVEITFRAYYWET